jgi:hypothetical protein
LHWRTVHPLFPVSVLKNVYYVSLPF